MSELGKCHPACVHRLVQAAWVSSAASICLCRVRVALHQTPQVGAQTPSSPRPSVSCYCVRLRHPGRYPSGRDGLRGTITAYCEVVKQRLGNCLRDGWPLRAPRLHQPKPALQSFLNLWGLVNCPASIAPTLVGLLRRNFSNTASHSQSSQAFGSSGRIMKESLGK